MQSATALKGRHILMRIHHHHRRIEREKLVRWNTKLLNVWRMQLGGYKNAIGFVLLCCALHPFRLTGVKISRKKAKVFNALASDMTAPSTYWNKISPLWYANGTNDRHHPFLVHSLSHQTDRNVSFRARRSIEIAMHKHTHQLRSRFYAIIKLPRNLLDPLDFNGTVKWSEMPNVRSFQHYFLSFEWAFYVWNRCNSSDRIWLPFYFSNCISLTL